MANQLYYHKVHACLNLLYRIAFSVCIPQIYKTNVNIEFKIRCIIPHFKKDFGTLFQFKPHSLYNFKFFTILTINEQQFGGGASLVWNSYSVYI